MFVYVLNAVTNRSCYCIDLLITILIPKGSHEKLGVLWTTVYKTALYNIPAFSHLYDMLISASKFRHSLIVWKVGS